MRAIRFHQTGGPEVLRAKAREVLGELGYQVAVRDSAWWSVREERQFEHLTSEGPTAAHPSLMPAVTPSPLRFQYRQSPRHIVPESADGGVAADTPARSDDDALVELDTMGRLTRLAIVPPQVDRGGTGGAGEPNWSAIVELSGLRDVALTETEPRWAPQTASEVRRAWTGTVAGEPVRVEAAAYRGRIVFARRGGAWDDPATEPTSAGFLPSPM